MKMSVQRSEDSEEASDRRRSNRVELIVRVDYKTVDELFSEFARNINEGGLFVETESPQQPGTLVDLHFRLPGSEQPVRATGTVVRVCGPDSGDIPGMGIEFEELDADNRERINEMVRSFRASS